jgi:transcriptional regulator with XRE-family HTH domain
MQTETLQKKIGAEIKKLRLINEWTQEQVAEQLYICRDAYGDIERGKTDICLSRLVQIADFFKVNVTFLFGTDSNSNTTNYTQYDYVKNNHINNLYNNQSRDEKLQHEIEKLQLTVAHLQEKVEDKQKIIDVYEKTTHKVQ